jgi:hypothetical protein
MPWPLGLPNSLRESGNSTYSEKQHGQPAKQCAGHAQALHVLKAAAAAADRGEPCAT